jgi:hypothetical protein
LSQVSFFMLAADEQAFLSMLLGRSDTLIVPSRFAPTEYPAPSTTLPPPELLETATLVNATLRPRPRFSAPGAGEVAGTFTSDLFRDPHIRFSRSRLVDGVLSSGRLYAKIGWLEPEVGNVTYRRWYAALERWIKKRYLRHRESWWIGPAAREWSRAGGKLELGPGGITEPAS